MDKDAAVRRYEDAKRGFLGACVAWRTCTPAGKAALQKRREWREKKQRLEEEAYLTTKRIHDALEPLARARGPLNAASVLLSEAVDVMEILANKANAARTELQDYPPPPPMEPWKDDSTFAHCYIEARTLLQKAIDEVCKTNPNMNRDLAMEAILKEANGE